jgi:mono/diheme cytochrome c family protein
MRGRLVTLRVTARLITLFSVMGGTALAADDIDDVLSGAGKGWYEKYCTQCHGPGGAPGKAVSSTTKEPVDLRTYVQRHGGKFPAADWLAVITDARPSSVHADVWKDIQREQAGPSQDATSRGIVGSIARYVRSIQK